MRVLIVTGDFAGENRNPWLLDDLAIAFADAGDEIDVLVHDTKHARPRGRNEYPDKRIRLYSVGPTTIHPGTVGKFVNYVTAGWGLHTLGFRHVRRRRYDLCVYTSIGIFSWGLPARLRRAGIVTRSVFVLWDFFPIHQLEIGRLTRRVLHVPLRALEALSMKDADVIAVMSPANERFLRAYHPNVHARTIIVPPWASDPLPAATGPTPRRQRFTLIFGGQLVAGRGVDTLLHAARRLQDDMVPIDLLIVGEGPARHDLIALAEQIGLANTTFLDRLPRDEYRSLLQSVHVGVAITVAGVTPPTFPSKLAEYCASAVPVVVCVESASDAGAIVEAAGAGLAVPAGDEASLASAIGALYEEHLQGLLESRARKARAWFEAELSVSRAANTLRATAAQQIVHP
jgi:glycosyltransferase involved in cell wall biosynthesis